MGNLHKYEGRWRPGRDATVERAKERKQERREEAVFGNGNISPSSKEIKYKPSANRKTYFSCNNNFINLRKYTASKDSTEYTYTINARKIQCKKIKKKKRKPKPRH